jgi:hypothetical protein
MGMMRKVLLHTILLVTFFILTHDVRAQNASTEDVKVNIDRSIPGYNCGIAGLEDVRNGLDVRKPSACCYFNALDIDDEGDEGWIDRIIGGVKDNIPIFGAIRRNYRETLQRAKKIQDSISSKEPCVVGLPHPDHPDPSDPECSCVLSSDDTDPDESMTLAKVAEMCARHFNLTRGIRPDGSVDNNEVERVTRELDSCIKCANLKHGYYSSFGCIPLTSFSDFITQFVFGIGVGLAGIVALLCIIYSAIVVQLSQGNAEKMQSAQENMTACILGLLLVIFSVFILQIAGITILPGL